MIQKTYRCDLCKDVVGLPGEGQVEGKRIRFMGSERLLLRSLTDSEASETVICNDCLAGLRLALQTEDKPNA